MNNEENQTQLSQVVTKLFIEEFSKLPLVNENRIILCSDIKFNFDSMSDIPDELEIMIINDSGVTKTVKFVPDSIKQYNKD